MKTKLYEGVCIIRRKKIRIKFDVLQDAQVKKKKTINPAIGVTGTQCSGFGLINHNGKNR